jgi:hypothetical protein
MFFYLKDFTFILHHLVLIIRNTFSHILVLFDEIIKKIILVLCSNEKTCFYHQKLKVQI